MNMSWHNYFTYEAATGKLFWRPRPMEHFMDKRVHKLWNTKYSGKEAGCVIVDLPNQKPAAIAVYIGGIGRKQVHRIIWEMHFDPIPDKMVIDHIDGNPLNNVLSNLRLATNTENVRNRKMGKNNTSGYKGVRYMPGKHHHKNPYMARIQVDQKWIYIGVYKTALEAKSAYDDAAKRYFGEFARP